jgi:uncharacterized repeat protein (TIGR03803 family)
MRACGALLLLATAAIALPAQTTPVPPPAQSMMRAPTVTFNSLYSFCAQIGCTDGAFPSASLLQATNGKSYGTTLEGGANGEGTVFSITANGTLNTLHSFDYTDGAYPSGGLIQATNGMIYGTTSQGGANSEGTVLSIAPSGALTTLYSFEGADGASPNGLVQATDGKFYGTTTEGGSLGYGMVFSITPSGTLTTLYSFDGTDGYNPSETLVQDTNGKFYGTTDGGGYHGDGTIFSLSVGLGLFVKTLAPFGKVGTAVHILGTNLTGATTVRFNGIAATFTVKSKSEITTSVPAGATTGIVKVGKPNGTLSSNVPFRVLP